LPVLVYVQPTIALRLTLAAALPPFPSRFVAPKHLPARLYWLGFLEKAQSPLTLLGSALKATPKAPEALPPCCDVSCVYTHDGGTSKILAPFESERSYFTARFQAQRFRIYLRRSFARQKCDGHSFVPFLSFALIFPLDRRRQALNRYPYLLPAHDQVSMHKATGLGAS